LLLKRFSPLLRTPKVILVSFRALALSLHFIHPYKFCLQLLLTPTRPRKKINFLGRQNHCPLYTTSLGRDDLAFRVSVFLFFKPSRRLTPPFWVLPPPSSPLIFPLVGRGSLQFCCFPLPPAQVPPLLTPEVSSSPFFLVVPPRTTQASGDSFFARQNAG